MVVNIIVFIILLCSNLFAQNDLESFLNPLPETTIVQNTFKSTRIINNHSVEIFEPQHLELRIAHRFGLLNSGLYELYGLDQAKIRVGFEYGLMQNMMVGIGRSTFQKTYDGYLKYLLLNQKKGVNNIPISIVAFSNMSINSLRKNYDDYPFLGRLSFCHQLLIASKINRQLSFQFMPSWIHWNMVEFNTQKNQTFALGGGLRYLITKSVSINSEYFFRVNSSDYDMQNYHDSFSVGIDIETGGHVFQLHVTNSMPMHESGFITRTSSDWGNGGIHFGFNISREFKL